MSQPSEPIRLVRAGVASLLLTGALLAGPAAPTVYGHAIMVASDPPDGSLLATAPESIRLTFNEAVSIDLTTVEVVDSDGDPVRPADVRADDAGSTVVIGLPRLERGSYRVSWDTFSDDDLHETTGSMVFGVGVADLASAAPVVAQVEASAGDALLRLVELIALAALFGALLVRVLVPPGLDPWTSTVRRRLTLLALAALGSALGVGLIHLITEAQAAIAAGSSIAAIFGTRFGRDTLVQEGILLLVGGLLLVGRRRRANRGSGAYTLRLEIVALALLVAVAMSRSLAGHLASVAGPVTALVVGTPHLVAAGAWVGGLMALAIAVVPAARMSWDAGVRTRVLARRFGFVAAGALVVLAISGLLAAGQLVASVDALILSPYGRVLLVKTAVITIVLVVAAGNAIAFHPALRARVVHLTGRGGLPGSHRRIVMEAAGAAGIIAVVALLGATPPARGPVWDPPVSLATSPGVAGSADDLLVTLAVRPNRPGPNFVSVGVFDTRRPAPAPIEAVTVVVTRQDGSARSLPARPVGDGRYEIAGMDLEAGAGLTVRVDVQRGGLVTAHFSSPWAVPAAIAPTTSRQVVISDGRLDGALGLLAGLLALAVSLPLLVIGARRAVLRRRAADDLPIVPADLTGRSAAR